MQTLVARSTGFALHFTVVALLLAGVAGLSTAGESQAPTAVVQHPAAQTPASNAPTQSGKPAIRNKSGTNRSHPADVRTPQQVDLTIHFQ
jgi:hypothetical protein